MGEDGNGNRGGLERTLRGRKRNQGGRKRDFEEEGNGTRNKMKQGFREDEKHAFEKVKTNSGFLLKCKIGSQHSQHSQHFPLKALRMRKLMGG